MSKSQWFLRYLLKTDFKVVHATVLTAYYTTRCNFAHCPYFRVKLCGSLHFFPLLHPQNTTHFMLNPLQKHILVLIHYVGYFHGGGRSSGLHGTCSITGVIPISVAL